MEFYSQNPKPNHRKILNQPNSSLLQICGKTCSKKYDVKLTMENPTFSLNSSKFPLSFTYQARKHFCRTVFCT